MGTLVTQTNLVYNENVRRNKEQQTMETTVNERVNVLAEFLEVNADEIEESTYAYDDAYTYGNQEYLVLTDEEANDKVADEIRDTLWAFNASFILENSKLDYVSDQVVRALQKVLEELCEDANELVYALLDDFDDFVESAVACDGRGHFIARYDGYENELNGYYIYRVD